MAGTTRNPNKSPRTVVPNFRVDISGQTENRMCVPPAWCMTAGTTTARANASQPVRSASSKDLRALCVGIVRNQKLVHWKAELAGTRGKMNKNDSQQREAT